MNCRVVDGYGIHFSINLDWCIYSLNTLFTLPCVICIIYCVVNICSIVDLKRNSTIGSDVGIQLFITVVSKTDVVNYKIIAVYIKLHYRWEWVNSMAHLSDGLFKCL